MRLLTLHTCALLYIGLWTFHARADDSIDSLEVNLADQFSQSIQPFVQAHCIACHGKDKAEAELVLSNYTSLTSVVDGYAYWKLVLERLDAGEMPPPDAETQPTIKEKETVIAWIRALHKHEAEMHAGDPGIVLARRLSNAEYDYTIHDLTGVDIRPTKEFPVDPANQAGFNNTGESLTMSPALWKKYYEAAHQVADNLVLQPDGFTVADHPMLVETDRDKYSVLRIVEFYQKQPTDFADYFLAAWQFQHRVDLGMPQATIKQIALQCKVSPNYLVMVWEVLNDSQDDVGPIAKLRRMWRSFPAPADAERATIRASAESMRDWVLNLRDQLVPNVPNLRAGPFRGGSQPAVLWKDRQMAANRRVYDPENLKVGQPPVVDSQQDSTPSLVEMNTKVTPRSARSKSPVAVVNPTPQPGAKLASGLGMPVAPVAKIGADGRPLSAVEIADLALAAQPVRKAGGPLPKTPDIVKFGGLFLEAQVTTTSSSVTAIMARAKKRGKKVEPDLFVPDDPVERKRYEAAFTRFADIFPDAFFISERARVYLDAETEEALEGRLLSAGLHSQTGYFRDDRPLYDLILDQEGRRELDRLWDIFNFNAAVPARMHLAFLSNEGGSLRDPAFDQFRPENHEATTQAMIEALTKLTTERINKDDLSDTAIAAINEHFEITAATNLWLDQTRKTAMPSHLRDLQKFAERAYRRPLSQKQRSDIAEFYHQSRSENGVDHEDAIRDSIVRILMSPYFLYRLDAPVEQDKLTTDERDKLTTDRSPSTQLLSNYELASRLSYFLWSSMPDEELLQLAAAGELQNPDVLVTQTRRMIGDLRARNFATEFIGHWLDFRRFEEHNAVDRERFPSFDNNLRQAMFEEPIRFFVDLVRHDRSVLNLLYGDYTFVNGPLAKHYSVSGSFNDNEWVRVDTANGFDRGGILPMAVFLTANSPGLRTSPVKRGYWVVRRVLGEHIPPPPATVPDLPADEKALGDLTLRETLAKHRENTACASCHARFDAFGLVFEGFGAIGERRTRDFADHPVDTSAEFPGGVKAAGLTGLRNYIQTHREKDFIDNFTSKLLTYGLSRTLLMSDDSLLDGMKARLESEEFRFGCLIETIVASPQFRSRRIPMFATTNIQMKKENDNAR